MLCRLRRCHWATRRGAGAHRARARRTLLAEALLPQYDNPGCSTASRDRQLVVLLIESMRLTIDPATVGTVIMFSSAAETLVHLWRHVVS